MTGKFALLVLSVTILSSCSEKSGTYKPTASDAGVKKNEGVKSVQFKFNPKQTDWSSEKLIGKVKSVTDSIYTVKYKHGHPEKGILKGMDKYVYNQFGFLVGIYSRAAYYNGSSTINTSDPKYPTDYIRYTYKFDDKGNKIEMVVYNDPDSTIIHSITKYKYDASGNLAEESDCDENGVAWQKWRFKYDDRGNKVEFSNYRPNGQLVYSEPIDSNSTDMLDSVSYEYDKIGNWIREFSITETNNGLEESSIIERYIEYYP